MRISAVIVCVQYSDFLSETLPLNKNQFEEIVVVTSKADKKTQKICEDNYVKCVQTDAFFEDDAPFNKAKGINEGLKHLKTDTWHLHLDADIFVGHLFKRIMDSIELDKESVYGCDRFMIHSYEEWIDQKNNPFIVNENNIYLHPWHHKVSLGTRIWRPVDGYIPIGFFQLWNPKGSGITSYPDKHKDAARSDMQFSLQWPRAKRAQLGEIIVWHLESEHPEKMGKNWDGRVIGKKGTKYFGPTSLFHELNEIEEELEDIDETLEEVEDELEEVGDNVDNLGEEIVELKTEVSEFKHELTDFKKEVKSALHDILEELGIGNTYKAQSKKFDDELKKLEEAKKQANELLEKERQEFEKRIKQLLETPIILTNTGPAVVVNDNQSATPTQVKDNGFNFWGIMDKFKILTKEL